MPVVRIISVSPQVDLARFVRPAMELVALAYSRGCVNATPSPVHPPLGALFGKGRSRARASRFVTATDGCPAKPQSEANCFAGTHPQVDRTRTWAPLVDHREGSYNRPFPSPVVLGGLFFLR